MGWTMDGSDSVDIGGYGYDMLAKRWWGDLQREQEEEGLDAVEVAGKQVSTSSPDKR
jgi:hypothetical protein